MRVEPKRRATQRKKRGQSKSHSEGGFDLAEIKWEASTDDEREDLRRNEPWFTFWPQLSDGDANALFSRILELRRTMLRSASAGHREQQEALRLGAGLVEGTLGWAVAYTMGLSFVYSEHLKSPARWWRDLHLERDRHLERALAAASLRQPVTLMLPYVRLELAEALDQLTHGVVHPMLEPSRGGRRGIARHKRAVIQLTLLMWIEWQVARGNLRMTQAQDTVRKACGLGSLQAIRNWKLPLMKYLTEVEQNLEQARRVGSIEAQDKDPNRSPELVRLATFLRSLDLRKIGGAYKTASLSRTRRPPKRLKRRAI